MVHWSEDGQGIIVDIVHFSREAPLQYPDLLESTSVEQFVLKLLLFSFLRGEDPQTKLPMYTNVLFRLDRPGLLKYLRPQTLEDPVRYRSPANVNLGENHGGALTRYCTLTDTADSIPLIKRIKSEPFDESLSIAVPEAIPKTPYSFNDMTVIETASKFSIPINRQVYIPFIKSSRGYVPRIPLQCEIKDVQEYYNTTTSLPSLVKSEATEMETLRIGPKRRKTGKFLLSLKTI